MNYNNTSRYKRAQKRVKELKGFYNHLAVYLIVNAVIIGARFVRFLSSAEIITDLNFELWLTFNTFSVSIFWGIGIVIHFFKVYEIDWLKSWEERKMKEFIAEEEK